MGTKKTRALDAALPSTATGARKSRAPREPKAAKQALRVQPRAPGSTAHDVATALVLRSSLRLALREGDVAAASRAVARLRVDGAGVLPEELVAARLARAERLARAAAAQEAIAVPAPGRWPRAAILRALVVVAVACVFALVPVALVPSASQDDGPPPAPLGVLTPPVRESRGRSTVTFPPVAVGTPEAIPTAAPAPEPTAAPTAVAAATAAPAVPVGVPGGVVGGVPGGAVGGVPGGVVGGAGSGRVTAPTPTPMPVALLVPSPIPTGHSRLTLMVLDSVTGQPLPGVCVVLGTGSCGPSKPMTNALGLWWLDYPSGSARFWDISLVDPRYRAFSQQVATVGTDQMVEIRLKAR